MSTLSTLAIVFSVLGGLLELSGLALVVREIVADRVQARTRFAPRSPREPRERTEAPWLAAPVSLEEVRKLSTQTRSLRRGRTFVEER